MRWFGWMFPLLAAAAAVIIGPGSAVAATTYSDTISGYEYAATSTQGSFAGTASGALPGTWSATVDHTPLGTYAKITGGDFHLATYLNGAAATVTGEFTTGTVRQFSGFTGCVNQQYAVNGTLGDVGFGSSGTGAGSFAGTLTHYRTKILGYCVTYSASITGSLTLTPS
jgi:hypothetical protein